ncbi:MAG: 23S rRNA (adenine(2503)-C(2))-methyltransferase RlmN, partial [Chitinivibrionia bacterium]|nr:23S rRNA (adenine(2503)-C(2))-methyltransferase RlmN [Chitinivibrionia bacterium]
MGYTKPQLQQLMIELGEKPYHGGQLFKWFYKMTQADLTVITDLSKDLRGRLSETFE